MGIDKIIACIGLVILLFIGVALLEIVIPINAKWELNQECRRALTSMEIKSSLDASEKANLRDKLQQAGFTNVTITVSGGSAQGDQINLRVEVDYSYKRLVGVMQRTNHVQHMVFNQTSTVRRVLN